VFVFGYTIEIHLDCQEKIHKACRKNPVLENAIKKKMKEIVQNPDHYKPLKHDFAGERRVHVMKSFVLRFEIDKNNQVIRFLSFDHHDDAYRR